MIHQVFLHYQYQDEEDEDKEEEVKEAQYGHPPPFDNDVFFTFHIIIIKRRRG